MLAIWSLVPLPFLKPAWTSGISLKSRSHKRCQSNPWIRKIPWSRKWLPTPVLLPGKFLGQRSLAGNSQWGRKSQTGLATEHTHIKKCIIIKTSSVYRAQTVTALHRSLIFMVGGLVAKSYLTLATPWTVAHQAPLSMGFSKEEYQSGLPWPSPRDLPNPGIKPGSPALQADALPSEPLGKPNKQNKQNHVESELLWGDIEEKQ